MSERKVNFIIIGLHALIVLAFVLYLLHKGINRDLTWSLGALHWSLDVLMLPVNLYYCRVEKKQPRQNA